MSKIEIINRALLKLGEPPVSSLNDAAFGKSYQLIFDDVKNLLLSSYPWRFAVALKHLVRKDVKYGDRFMYPLPTDCLLLLKVFGAPLKDLTEPRPYALQAYDLADNCILSFIDDGIDVEYVRSIDDDTPFPPLFREALATKVAAELAMRIKHSASLKQNFDNEFFTLIQQAQFNNEIAKDTELIPDNSWVLVRQVW